MTYEIPARLTAAAKLLWPQMMRDEEPMPPWAAVDNLQDDWNDRDLCIRVLVIEACDHLKEIVANGRGLIIPPDILSPANWMFHHESQVREFLDLGLHVMVGDQLELMWAFAPSDEVSDWGFYVRTARKVLAICREMEVHRNPVL